MQGMKPNVKQIAAWICSLLCLLSLLLVIGRHWGLTPLPEPPRGVRLKPLYPPLRMKDVKPDNAACYYLEAARLMKNYKVSDESLRQMGEILQGNRTGETAAIEQTLRDCVESLRLVRKGVSMGFCRMPMTPEFDDKTCCPYLSKCVQMAKLFCCTGELARREGKCEQAVDEYATAMKFGRDCAVGGPLISWLAGGTSASLGMSHLRTLMIEDSVGTEAAGRIRDVLADIDSTFPPLAEALRYELIWSKRMADVTFTNKAVVNSRAMGLGAIHAYCNAAFGEMIVEIQKPYWQNECKKVTEKWDLSGKRKWLLMADRPIPRLFVSLVLPSLETPASSSACFKGAVRATALICALTQYMQSHAVFPDRLDQLVPEFLTAFPLDPFDGRPFQYQREGAGWVIWSSSLKYRKQG